MPTAAYFRRQADICFRLALIASDEEVSNRLIFMAQEYTAKGDALAKKAGELPDIGPDDASLVWLSDNPDPARDC